MHEQSGGNGVEKARAQVIETPKVSIDSEANVVVVQQGSTEGASPEQLRAETEQLTAILSSPVVEKLAVGLFEHFTAKANAEAARAQAEAQNAKVLAEVQRKANAEQNERGFKFATSFLRSLTFTGVCAMLLVALFAFTGALKDSSLSAFAMFVVGSIFGGTIYGTTLRKPEKP